MANHNLEFEPGIFICFLLGILLITPIINLDIDLFIFNETIITIGLILTLFLSNFMLGDKKSKGGKEE